MELTGNGFKPLSLRWKIERTIAWMNWDRRLSKDYECTITSSESMIYLPNIHRIYYQILDSLQDSNSCETT
jgi:hypothetical protein